MANSRSQGFRCICCGARWERHFTTCPSCFESGVVVPWAERAPAAIDSMPVPTTAKALLRMSWKKVKQNVYPELELGVGALVGVFGGAGQGKSTYSCRLADGIPGPALLVSAEEGASPSLSARLQRANVKGDDFFVLPRASVDQVVAYAQRIRAESLVIDSLQVAAWSPSDLRRVIELVGSLAAVVVVLQVNKQGLPAGANAVIHEVDVSIHVEAMSWRITKSRYQDWGGGVGGDVLPASRETQRPYDTEREENNA